MVHDDRFSNLEQKVDKVKDDVNEIKMELKLQRVDLSRAMEIVEKHVAGDNKIINEIAPLMHHMPSLVDIVQEYKYEKEKKAKFWNNIKNYSIMASIGAALATFASFLKETF